MTSMPERTVIFRRAAMLLATLTVLWHGTAGADQRAQIEAVDATVISSEIAGRIDDIGYREGDTFGQGDELVGLNCTSYRAERDRVSAKLATAQRKRDNQEQLARLQSAGQLEVDLSRLSVSESAAELRAARANVARCAIDAPFDGRVVELYASMGQSVKAQEKLLKIVGQELNARVIVPANWLAWLEKGNTVNLDVRETRARVSGEVVRIGAAVDAVSHTIPVWVRLEPSDTLRPGMSATATFPDAPEGSNAGDDG